MGGQLTRPCCDARRFPSQALYPITEGYTYAAKGLDLSIVQGPFSVAPCQNLNVTIRSFFHRCVAVESHAAPLTHSTRLPPSIYQRELNLSATDVTDTGMVHLRNLRALEVLFLDTRGVRLYQAR